MQKFNSFVLFLISFFMLALFVGCGEESTSGTEEGKGETKTTEVKDGEYALKVQPQVGQNFNWKISSDDETNTQIPDQERGEGWNDVMDAFGWSMQVEGNVEQLNEDGSSHLVATFPHVEAYYNGNGIDTKYNSDSPETAVNGMGFEHYFNKNISFDLYPDGSVKNMQGANQVFGPLKDPGLDKVADVYLSQIFEGYFKWLPKEPVKIGDSWDVQHQYESGVGIVLINHCTLKNVENNLAQIDITSQAINYDEAVPTYMDPVSIGYELSGEAVGTVTIDLSTGFPAHIIHNVALTGFTTFDRPDQETNKYFTNKMYILQLQNN